MPRSSSLVQALRPTLPILIGASLMLTLSMGLRQSFGIFMQPLTHDIGISVTQFTLALAVQNLAWGFLQPVAGANQVSLRLGPRPPQRECWVLADHRRVKQVLINLLSNAIKYNNPGGRAVITVARVVDELSITVSDNGIGIPAEDLPKLFSPFERLGRQRTDIEGSGIGLALTKRLVTVMGGGLDVTSAPGEGTTFSVTLPLTEPPDLEVAVGARPTSAAAAPSRVLYIEDNPSNRDLLTNLMARTPEWTITLAATGKGGLELARAHPPTVILLDLHLPDIGGATVLQLLKATPATAAIPVAILSADAQPSQIKRLLAAGAERYLTKPLKISDLLDFLGTHGNAATDVRP